MDRLASRDNRLSPLEGAANNHAQSNTGWDNGDCSSSGNNMQEQAFDGGSKTRFAWYSSSSSCSGTDLRSEDWSSEPSNIRSTSYIGNQVTDRSQNMQTCSSTGASLYLSSNHKHLRENNRHSGLGAGLPRTPNKSGHFWTEQIQTFDASCSNIGSSSGTSGPSSEYNEASVPSFGTWGSSCKRKALEGTSGHFYTGGSSNSNQPMENTVQHPVPACCSAGNLSVSSSVSSTNLWEQLNSRSGDGTSRVRLGRFPSSSVQGIAENHAENFALRSNLGHRESVPFDTSRRTSVRHSSIYAAQPQPQSISNSNTLELMSPMTPLMNPNDTLNQSLVHVNEARGLHEARGTRSNSWNGSFSSRGGSSSSSFMLSGERSLGTREEVNIRSSLRNNPECPVIASAPETRNTLEDQINWSFTPGTSVSSRNYPSGSWIGPSSGGRSSSAARLPRRNQTSLDQHRLSESVPWIPFPRIESDYGTQRSPFARLPLASSSLDETEITIHAQHQSEQRPAAFLMDIPDDDTNSWNLLAAVEGRHRLIRQVLNAMRRGVHLRAEEYVDPFLNGFAELHDRHRDMRLDVDNMSYEELLALEERIGNVSTGLSDKQIRGSMKQRKYEAANASPGMEPCCICQENYIGGDDYIGILDCGHEFHTSCIKQWLMLKNICPICKMTALET